MFDCEFFENFYEWIIAVLAGILILVNISKTIFKDRSQQGIKDYRLGQYGENDMTYLRLRYCF